MFAIFNWALVVFVWFFIKETKGKSLEEMDESKYNLVSWHLGTFWSLTNRSFKSSVGSRCIAIWAQKVVSPRTLLSMFMRQRLA